MTDKTQEVIVFQLTSGTQLIARVVHEDKEGAFNILDFPLEITVSFDQSGSSRMYLARYMPYALNAQVFLYTAQVETLAVASATYAKFYDAKVIQFREAMEGPLDRDLEDESDNQSSEEEEVDESQILHKHNTSIH